MSKLSAVNRRTPLIIVGVLVVLLGVGFPTVQALHRRHLNALFSGPAKHETETRSGFYSQVIYDLKDYRPGAGSEGQRGTNEPSLLDKPEQEKDWELAIGGIHHDFQFDADTGATKVARLRSPTVYQERWVPRFLTITYPPEGVVFPPNLCSPFIEWSDTHNDLWQVTVSLGAGKQAWRFLSTQRRWRIPDDVWRQVKEHTDGGPAQLLVKGLKRSGWWDKTERVTHASQEVTFRISDDPADNALVYRLVDPPFQSKKTPNMFVRDIRQKSDRLFLSARQEYCLNCHTFSSQQAERGWLGLQVRYIGKDMARHRVYLAIYDIAKRRGCKAILPFGIQQTTFMRWSPDGTKLALSANIQIAAVSPLTFETQSISHPTSDIAVYDATNGTACLVPGASDPGVAELYPCWTPDGKSIVYSSTSPGQHPSVTRYQLRIIPYNDGRGGTSEALPGIPQTGKSVFYPRFSPDGKWFSFVRADYGSLIKASSDIYIAPADLKTPPKSLECNRRYAADSWYSWSSNSRWIAFASKRDDGIFARIYMTHIDDEGHASPAARLPIENPHMRMTFNIPEFVVNVPPIRERDLFSAVGLKADVYDVKSPNSNARELKSE